MDIFSQKLEGEHDEEEEEEDKDPKAKKVQKKKKYATPIAEFIDLAR